MTIFQHVFLVIGALFGFLGIAMGAFGAHLLKSKLSTTSFEVFEVAVRYQLFHALVLISLVAILGWVHSIWLIVAGGGFISGTIIFSGSLYVLVFSGVRSWGAVTPVGGLLLLMGWLSLLVGGIMSRAP